MATIKPFKAIMPREDLAKHVASLPYDVMNSEEAKTLAQDNPYSFLHIDKAEIDLNKDIYEYDESVYIKASENLNEFRDNNILIKEEKECLYIYKQVMNGRSQIGIVACVSVDESLNGIIKKHEYTKPDKELDRTNHIKYCNAHTGTILITYKNKEIINKIVKDYSYNNKPIYDFITSDNISHTIWKIEDKETLSSLIEGFEKVPYLYIADGHHRAASAENIAKKMRTQNQAYTGKEEFNYFLAMIAPDNELMILDYNRVVKHLNGLEDNEFIDKLKENFEIREIKDDKYKPNEKGKIGMYLSGKWYEIKVKEGMIQNKDIIKSLDVSILHDNIINPILGIKNSREDKRIDFIGGIRGLNELENRVDNDMKVAFALYPTSIEELIKVADERKIMPAKSTWFEPKVRCGLFLHEL
ncbi:DUF1015 family protein [Romboutsia sedimentorum]|uniref:DUF1015 family protein n=1 Tax=Romboutsia sedimentorum TaxID=1368474 RepID=A0ABT7E4S9_9FIRM|nr:DUF1015 family protein [Romboutsia sedimentorum]MDK2561933.1 DUF1015 family protein [Romboutsia sedimentorum]MDK2586727.1 DUF1015 family protein [Romboutsia sedimentorum]